ncbi:MAG TPA: sensor histidine kinase [Thermopolyspora sp.]
MTGAVHPPMEEAPVSQDARKNRLAGVFAFGGDERQARRRRMAGLSIGLGYLVLYSATEVINGGLDGAERVWSLIALAAFALCLAGAALTANRPGRPGRLTIVSLVLASVVALACPLLFGSGWLILPIYLTVPFGLGLPTPTAFFLMTGLVVVVFVEGVLTGAALGGVFLVVFLGLTLGFLFMSVSNTRRLVGELRRAQREVARLAADDERLRIARDLHDLLGHSLSLIVLKSELAGRLAEQGSSRAADEIRDVEAVARKALVEVREAVAGYRRRGLSEELDNARIALEAAGVRVTVAASGTPLPDPLDGLFGWAVREGATNVMRHADATRCEITIAVAGGTITLDITDDGPGRVWASPGPGSGLAGLTERVTAADGAITAGPLPGGGFRLRIRVPADVDSARPESSLS